MKIIKLIIRWIINFFKSFFGREKQINKKIKETLNSKSNNRYLKGYESLYINNESDSVNFPLYLEITDDEKELIINKIAKLERKIDKIIEFSQKKNIDNDEKKRDLKESPKNITLSKKNVDDIKKSIKNIKTMVKNKKISVYQNQQINENIEKMLGDNQLEIDMTQKITTLDKDTLEVLDNYDKNIKDKVKKEYKVVNYVTITTLLLDETNKEIKKIEEDFHHHKYNKYYYERELNKIKDRIENIWKLRNKDSVLEEIKLLRKEIYTKNKDKYDLLYNDEVFFNFKKSCDDLIKKVNRRVIDLKIEKEEREKKKKEKENREKEEKAKNDEKIKKDDQKDESKENKELLENILRRFQDIELARRILLIIEQKNRKIKKEDNILSLVNNLYLDFISGDKCKFNYERNKTKLELVKFINGINYIHHVVNNVEYLPFEHINFSMSDLLEYSLVQKDDLENFLSVRYNYPKEKNELSILVDNKLAILKEKEEKKEEKPHVLIKTNNEK